MVRLFFPETITRGREGCLELTGRVSTTQDIGTVKRYDELSFDRMIYVVGNEQEHHFKLLFGILDALKPELMPVAIT